MEVTKTIKHKIISHGEKTFEDTLLIFREALSFIVEVVNKEWKDIHSLSNKDALSYIEFLIHRTKKNPSPKYDFTSKFYKFPSYFRRAAINKSVGIVRSFQSNYDNWFEEKMNALKEGKKFTKFKALVVMSLLQIIGEKSMVYKHTLSITHVQKF